MAVGSRKFIFKGAAGPGQGTYFGDGSDGSQTFDGTSTDSVSAGASSYGRYFKDGTTTTGYPRKSKKKS